LDADFIYFGIVEGDNFAITTVGVHALKGDEVSSKLRLFKSDEEADKCGGVTLLHILSELEGSP
jgi:hypothetical protein